MTTRTRRARSALLTLGLVATFLPSAATAAPPALDAPAEVRQGERLILVASPNGKRRCALTTVSPAGREASYRVTGRRGVRRDLRVALRVGDRALPGTWEMRLRCRKRSSHDRELTVLAEGAASGRHHRLAPRVAVGTFDSKPPEYFTAPAADQDGPGAPQFSSADVDGLGAPSGDRSAGAVQWALQQQGSTGFYMLCLRFAANAFGAPYAGYNTALIAANALGTRDRGLSAARAPFGALVFFRYVTREGASLGHVGISLGDGRMVHAVQTVRVDHIDSSTYWRSNYLGWAWAPGHWPGRAVAAAPASSQPKTVKPPATTKTTPAKTTPPTSTPAAPSPSVTLVKGGSAQGLSGCSSSYCRFLAVEFKNFPAGSHTIRCRASGGDEGGFYAYTRSGSSGASAYCYYGFPGRTVWVTVDGVSSNRMVW